MAKVRRRRNWFLGVRFFFFAYVLTVSGTLTFASSLTSQNCAPQKNRYSYFHEVELLFHSELSRFRMNAERHALQLEKLYTNLFDLLNVNKNWIYKKTASGRFHLNQVQLQNIAAGKSTLDLPDEKKFLKNIREIARPFSRSLNKLLVGLFGVQTKCVFQGTNSGLFDYQILEVTPLGGPTPPSLGKDFFASSIVLPFTCEVGLAPSDDDVTPTLEINLTLSAARDEEPTVEIANAYTTPIPGITILTAPNTKIGNLEVTLSTEFEFPPYGLDPGPDPLRNYAPDWTPLMDIFWNQELQGSMFYSIWSPTHRSIDMATVQEFNSDVSQIAQNLFNALPTCK